MLKIFCCAICAGSLACLPLTSNAVAPDAKHPLLGTWSFTEQGKSCTEVYTFKPDGTTHVTSGTEVTDSQYEFSAAPSKSGFFKWTDKVTADNGKPDCGGQTTQVGEASTYYIQLHPSGKMMIICEDESLKACFGPLKKVEGGS